MGRRVVVDRGRWEEPSKGARVVVQVFGGKGLVVEVASPHLDALVGSALFEETEVLHSYLR